MEAINRRNPLLSSNFQGRFFTEPVSREEEKTLEKSLDPSVFLSGSYLINVSPGDVV